MINVVCEYTLYRCQESRSHFSNIRLHFYPPYIPPIYSHPVVFFRLMRQTKKLLYVLITSLCTLYFERLIHKIRLNLRCCARVKIQQRKFSINILVRNIIYTKYLTCDQSTYNRTLLLHSYSCGCKIYRHVFLRGFPITSQKQQIRTIIIL